MADTFQEIFKSTLDFHTTVRKKKVRVEFAHWLTPNLRKHVMTSDCYARQRNNVTKEIRKALFRGSL